MKQVLTVLVISFYDAFLTINNIETLAWVHHALTVEVVDNRILCSSWLSIFNLVDAGSFVIETPNYT